MVPREIHFSATSTCLVRDRDADGGILGAVRVTDDQSVDGHRTQDGITVNKQIISSALLRVKSLNLKSHLI